MSNPLTPEAGRPQPAAVISASGGMDSTSLLLHLLSRHYRVLAISFDYGQKHRQELQRLQANLEYLQQQGWPVRGRTVQLSGLSELFHSALINPDWEIPLGHYAEDSMRATVVPNRNAIFASITYAAALSWANRESIECELALGVHAGDHAIYPDCRPPFYEALHQAFTLGNWDSERVQLRLPYMHWNKADILRDAQRSTEVMGLNFDQVFRNTLTSYAPDSEGRSHGFTGSDVERILAFDELALVDPLDYGRPWDEVVAQARECEQEFRSKQT